MMKVHLRNPVRTGLMAVILCGSAACAAQQPIRITADLTEAPRKLYHAEVDIPVHAGPVALTTPEWIPGNHTPTGPVEDIIGVVFTANGKTLPWTRDETDLYQFHVEVPAGVTSLHAHLDCIVTTRVSDHIAVLEWEKLLLYPAHTPVRDIAIQPSVIVPAGWGIGTALTPVRPFDPNTKPGGTVQFEPTTVEQLQDSPIIAGEYFHEFPLAPDISPKHYIDVVSDQPADSNLRPELLAEISNLVREADAAYASHHYNSVPLPAHALGRRRRRRPGARPVLGQRHRREGLLRPAPPARQRRPARARVHPLLERQVSPPLEPLPAGLPHYAAGRAALGLRGHDAVPRQRARRALRPQVAGAVPRPARALRRQPGQQARPRLALHRRHRHRRQHAARPRPDLVQLAPRPGLLPGGRTPLARRRHPHPPAHRRQEVAHRLPADLPRQRRQHRPAHRALQPRGTHRRPEPGRAVRLGRLPPRPHRPHQPARRPRRHRARRLQARLPRPPVGVRAHYDRSLRLGRHVRLLAPAHDGRPQRLVLARPAPQRRSHHHRRSLGRPRRQGPARSRRKTDRRQWSRLQRRRAA